MQPEVSGEDAQRSINSSLLKPLNDIIMINIFNFIVKFKIKYPLQYNLI